MITSVSTSFRNLSNIFGQVSLNNISQINSANASTMITGNESLILTSIKKNNKAKSFQKKNRKLKNDIKNLKRINIEHNSYRSLILQKSLINIAKKEKININLPIKNSQSFKEFYDKIKSDNNNVDSKSTLSNRIIEQVYDNKSKKLSTFNKKMKTIILLKKFIHDQKQNYENKLIKNEFNESLIKNINLKIHNINFIIKELDNILTLYSYVKFLARKRRQLREENLMDYTTIDYLKNDINELFIKIKSKADKLADLINIRNLLVGIKEGLLNKDLPLNFTFFNDNYKSTLDKIFKSLISYINRKNQDENKNFSIPTNLLEYIYSKTVNKMKNINLNNRYKNYLKINYPIFKDEEDFQKCLLEMQNNINGFFIFTLNKSYRKYESEIDPTKMQNENFDLIKSKDIKNQKKKILENLKEKNNFLNIYYENVIKESKIIKYNKIKDSEKNSLRNLNKLLLESVINSDSRQDVKFLYQFNQLKAEKNYKIKGAYIYHTLMKNILSLYKTCPHYIIDQHNFHIEEFRFRINNFNNYLKASSYKIFANEIYYLLGIYESAVSYFLSDFNNLKNKQSEISIFNKIRDNIFNNRKRELFKFRIGLEGKILNAKFEKIYEKQNRKIIRRQNLYFPDIHSIKLKRNKSQEKIIENINISNIPDIKFDYSLIKY